MTGVVRRTIRRPDLYLLDTNACLDFTLARSEVLKERIRQNYRKGLAISAVTLAELRVGARHPEAEPEDEERVERFVGTIKIHDFDGAAAEAYGNLARQIGVKRTSFDRLIAAHALSLGLVVVTRNKRDFADVPGLMVENWTE